MPPFETQYGVLPGMGQSSWTEVMLTMVPPPPWEIICLAASCVPKNALLRLISSTFSYWSSVVSRIDVRVSMPALLTITSTRPKALTADGDQAFEIRDLADVCFDADGLVAERRDLRLELLGRFGVAHVVDDDVGALACECQHDALADAAVSTGDDCHLALEGHVGRSFQSVDRDAHRHGWRSPSR